MKRTIAMRVALLSLFVAFAMVLVGCGASTSSGDTAAPTKDGATKQATIEGLKTPGTLTVGLRSSAAVPMVIESKGTTSGLDVDLSYSLAGELGLAVSFKRVDDVAQALQDDCDIVMSAEAGDSYELVGHYVDSATAFFHAGKPTTAKVDDLSGKTIAVEDGSAAQRSLRITSLSVSEVPCKTLSSAFETLEKGKSDYVLCHTTSGAYLTTRHGGTAFAGTLSEPVALGIALGADNATVKEAVQKAFEAIKDNGILTEVRRTWLGSMPVLTQDSRVADVPLKETTGDTLEELSSGEESLNVAMDGSTAGANAVTFDGSGARVSSPTGSSDAAASSDVAATSDASDYEGASEPSSGYQSNGTHYDEGQASEPAQSYQSYDQDDSYDYTYDDSYDQGYDGSYDEGYQEYDSGNSYDEYDADYGEEPADYGNNDYVTE